MLKKAVPDPCIASMVQCCSFAQLEESTRMSVELNVLEVMNAAISADGSQRSEVTFCQMHPKNLGNLHKSDRHVLPSIDRS